MLNSTKSKSKKILINKNKNNYDDNVSKVSGFKQELKRLKLCKSNLGFKVRVVEMRNKNLETRKKPLKKINSKKNEECSHLQKSRNRLFNKSESPAAPPKALIKTQSRKKFNTAPTSNMRKIYQKNISEKKSLLTRTEHSEDSKKTKNSSLIFVSLNNINEEKGYKNKSRKSANASELQRLRKKLWKKSSYHKRFLGKRDSIKPEKNKKNKNDVAPRQSDCLSSKRTDLHLRKSEIKIITSRNNSEQNVALKLQLGENNLDTKKEDKINLEIQPLNPMESLEPNVSMVDENYIKSLFFIANCNTGQGNLKVKPQNKDTSVENENKTKASEKEFFISRKKKKETNLQLNSKTGGNSKTDFVLLPDSCVIKSQRNSLKEGTQSTNVIRDATKSESQLKVCKKEKSDISKGIINRQKKAYSKLEINSNQQKTKTRKIRKNKKDTIKMAQPSEVLKTEVVQEIWRRETIRKPQNSQCSDLSTTISENHYNENTKALGIESYQILKKFVEEEVYRISHKYIKNTPKEKDNKIKNDVENENKDICKEQSAIFYDREFPGSLKKKILKKPKETFSHDKIQLQNPEIFNLVNLIQKEEHETAKSKLKLLAEENSSQKKTPDETIKNWSIVNRLEQAFLALGTPDFRTKKTKEPMAKNTKGMRTNDRNVTEVKKTEKNEKNGKKSSTPRATNKQKDTEISKPLLNERQLNVLHKKESTSSSRKLVTHSSGHSAKCYKDDNKTKPKEEKTRPQLLSSSRPIRPTPNPTNKSGIKPPTKTGISFGLQNKVQGSRQIGKFGKKNLCRPHLSESSGQNKNDDENLERKKTFHIISLKDSVIMQPRRSKSCNKIERNTEMNRIHSISSTGSQECQNIDVLNRHEQNLDFWEFFNKIEKMRADEELKNNRNRTEQKNITSASQNVKSKENIQIYENQTINAEEESLTVIQAKNSNQEIKWEQEVPTEFSKDIREVKDVNNGSKVRAIKERSILSIRTQNSHTNISPTQEKYTPKVTVPKVSKKGDVFLPPIPSHSESSLISTGTYDIAQQEMKSSVKEIPQMVTWDDGLELLKPPAALSSKSIQIVSSKISTHEKPEPKTIRNAPWEQDIKQYRALVREIMSQYKRIDGFLKQSENMKTFMSEDLKKPSEAAELNNLSGELNIQQYRKKIIKEYQQLPIFEYKSKLQETEENDHGKSKRKNLLVVHPVDTEVDLDVKDYEPSMKTVLGSRLYVDKENFTKRTEIYKNRKEKKSSLQEVTLYKSTNEENSNATVSTPKSCLCYFEQIAQNILPDEILREKNSLNSELDSF